MSLGGLLVALILVIITLVIIARPLFAASRDETALTRQRARAQAYYERVVLNIRDLDDDHTMGKIDTTEYQTERELWMQRGSVVLKLLDDLDKTPLTSANADDAAIDAAIEQAVAKTVKNAPEQVYQ